MCNVGAAMILQGAGAAQSAYGSYTGGLAQESYYNYLADNQVYEAKMTRKAGEQEATFAEDAGARESKLLREKTAEIEGTQKAVSGANVGGGSVTSENIATDTTRKATLDQMAIKYNADLTAWKAQSDAKMKAWELESEAGMNRVSGKGAKRAGTLGAFNSLLSGAGQVASTWYLNKIYSPTKMGQSKLFNSGKPMPVYSGAY